MDDRRSRWHVRIGLALLLLSYFLPMHGCHAVPKQFEPAPPEGLGFVPDSDNPLLIPAHSMAEEVSQGWERGGLALALWEARLWYPYLLVPLWVLAMAALARVDSAGARRLGRSLVALSALVAVFEGIYLFADFNTGFMATGPQWIRPVGGFAVWGVVAVVLWHRAKGRDRWTDVEAAVASQAMLGALHAFSYPAWDCLRWLLQGHGPWSVTAALSVNYRPGLWLAALGFLLVARPGYFSGRPAAAGYDAPSPCPSPSSTRTPTSTSIGSTPIGTPCSSAPAPPASSRS